MELGPGLIGAAVRAAFDPFLVMNRSGAILFVSDTMQNITGYAASELQGQPLTVLLPRRLHGVFSRFVSEFFTGPVARQVGSAQPLYFLCKDGSERRIEFSIAPFTWEGELHAACVLRDSPDRATPALDVDRALKRLETRLNNTMEELEILMEHAPAAIAVLDRDMRYRLASRRWIEDYELQGSIVGRSHYELFPDIPERWKQMHARCLAGEHFSSDEDEFVRSDGRREYLRWQMLPWRDVEDNIGGLTIFSEMITQRKLAELALREHRDLLDTAVRERTAQLEQARDEALRASAAKSRFIAGVSHDMKQPLQAAALLLEALERRASPELSSMFGRAEAAIIGAAEKLNGLMDMSRLEEGVLQPRISAFPIHAMLETVTRAYHDEAEAKGLRLRVITCKGEGASDRLLLARIVDNFVSNAVKYTERGEINVGCEPGPDGQVCIFVTDTGIGLDADALERVFDPYVQIDNPTGDSALGYGLGLAICRTIADALHCELGVSSELGRGSKFTVTIPLAPALEDAGAPSRVAG